MIESKIFQTLTTTTSITDAVSTRIYPLVLPQNSTFPCLSYARTDNNKLYCLMGSATLENPHIEINGWALTYTAIKDLSTRIIAAMSSAVGFTCILISDIDAAEVNELNEIFYRVTQNYSCWNRE